MKHLPLLLAAAILSRGLATAAVEKIATPRDGIQPRALVAPDGTLHLLWYQGDARGGDIWHATRHDGKSFGEPVRVNSVPRSAVAAGTIRGAQAVMGKSGRIHVVWNGAMKNKGDRPPLFYSRLAEDGKSFEPQRPMSGDWIMDGGGAVAADGTGRVHVFYHGGNSNIPQEKRSEAGRRVLVRSSDDDGKTFGAERVISPDGAGVCGCCAMQAIASSDGTVIAIYRTASNGGKQRDIASLTSHDGGKTFQHAIVDQWSIAGCPMSSMSLVEGPQGVLGAWEREGQIFLGALGSGKPPTIISPDGPPNQRKHPVLAAGEGKILVAWTEGTGWQKGGTMGWQILEGASLKPTKESGSAPGVKVWSFVSVAPAGKGFVIVE